MNLQQLRYVKALVDKGSFVAAASCCAVTQPTLSNGIAQLEAELGYRLFRRTTRSVSLTPYGEQLLPTILEILSLFERLKELSKIKLENTTVAFQVGISPLVGITKAGKILSPFRAQHPSVEILFREASIEDLCTLLNRGVIDVMIAQYDVDLPSVANCVSFPVEEDPLVFLPRLDQCAKWRGAEVVSANEIAGETFVMVSRSCGLSRITARLFEENKLELHRYPAEASSYAAVKEFTEASLACGILPRSKLYKYDGRSIPIVQRGRPIAIEYYVFGRPSTISSELFPQLWNSLLAAKTSLNQTSYSGASFEHWPSI
jgi:DNA-binding transcriptional LysR family regulator